MKWSDSRVKEFYAWTHQYHGLTIPSELSLEKLIKDFKKFKMKKNEKEKIA